MIQHVPHSESEKGADDKPSFTWTELSKLRIGRCQCSKCEKIYTKVSINDADEQEKLHKSSECMKTFSQPPFPYKVLNNERRTPRLDVGEVKINILETAFDTAESVASIGAIVSIP